MSETTLHEAMERIAELETRVREAETVLWAVQTSIRFSEMKDGEKWFRRAALVLAAREKDRA